MDTYFFPSIFVYYYYVQLDTKSISVLFFKLLYWLKTDIQDDDNNPY